MIRRLGLALASIVLLGLALAQAQQTTTPTDQGTVVCAYNSSLPTIATGNFGYVQCDVNGKLLTTAVVTQATYSALCTGQIKATATACGSAAAHTVGVYDFGNAANAATSYIQLFDVAVGSVVLGTTVPRLSFELPAGGGRVVSIPPGGDAYATQITIACTTTATGSTAPASNCSYNVIGK